MADVEPAAKKVEDIRRRASDSAGYRIISVYSYNPPAYAIYRTSERLIVQFSDDADEALRQRQRISPLAPMRGQINALIDGWRKAGLAAAEAEADAEQGKSPVPEEPAGNGWMQGRRRAVDAHGFKRACEYDRRVADALITVLDGEDGDAKALETAQTLLAQVKNDILAERTAIARISYVRWALMLVGGMLLATTLLAGPLVRLIHAFPPPIWPVWTAIAGGSLGAFFSAAVGLKGRTLAIDLQWRENLVDITLRILIGAIAGGVFYALLRSGFVAIKLIDVETLTPGVHKPPYSDFNVFMTGFLAGFIERLVPQLLNDTNIGTPEPAGRDTPNGAPPGGGKGDAGPKGGDGKPGGGKGGAGDDKPGDRRDGSTPRSGSGGGATAPAGPTQPLTDPTGGTG